MARRKESARKGRGAEGAPVAGDACGRRVPGDGAMPMSAMRISAMPISAMRISAMRISAMPMSSAETVQCSKSNF